MSVKVDVGTPTGNIKPWATAEVHFHGFANLTTTRGQCVSSPEFTCLDHQCQLKLYPGGRPNADEGYVSITLTNATYKDIEIEYGYSLKDAAGREVGKRSPKTTTFPARRAETIIIGQTSKNFAERSRIMDILVGGALIIDVRMRLSGVATTETLPFIPQNPAYKLLLSMFNDEETADTLFEVTDQPVSHDEDIHKRSKTTTTFHAHRAVVRKSSATLGELCCGSGEDSVTTVKINDIRPDIFRHLLCYLYGGKVPDEELEKNAKDIVEAADKYGIVGLKLEAEAAYVNFTTNTFDNAIDNLLYADGKNCALLKETVMDFIAEHTNEAAERLSFDDVPGSAMKDLLVAIGRGKGGSPASSTNANGFSKMRVNTLRKMLHEKGLDVDGSREMMIARLEGESS